MYKMNALASAVSCILGAGSLVATSAAVAQDNRTDNEGVLEEVVVTGSRIKRDVFSAASSIDVISTDDAKSRGIADVATLLRQSTAAAGSPQVTPASSVFQDGPNNLRLESGGKGTATISMRGLGAGRTLSLINGRRVGPAGTRGGVTSFDLNILPLAALDRVEVLKDGASSIYGSEAIGGVVNYITKKGDGGSIDAYTSQPSDSGGEETRISASWGKSFDRGHFRVTADYYKQDNLAKGDRDYYDCTEDYIFSTDTGERRDAIDPRTGKPSCSNLTWGHIWIYDYSTGPTNVPGVLAQFTYEDDLGQYVPGYAVDPNNPEFLAAPAGWFPTGYDRDSDGVVNSKHPFDDAASVVPKAEFTTLYAEGEFELSDRTTIYSELLLNRRETNIIAATQYYTYIYNENWNFDDAVGAGNGTPLSAGWTGAQWLSPTPITDHGDSKITVDYTRFVAGLRGDITDNWSYDLSYQYSLSDGDYQEERLFDDGVRANEFINGSCVGTVTAVRGVPCIDVPWLDPEFERGNISQDVRDFLFGVETGNTEYTQWSVEGFVTGDLFEMPAGTAGVAIGFHYRNDEIVDVPGPITLAENIWIGSVAGITTGDQTTKAIFAEIELPLLQDRPGFENLTLTVSGRYNDVDTYGDGSTYKAGINWQITPAWRIRATQGTSFRTPALFELFLADQTGTIGPALDPCLMWGTNLANGSISQKVADNCAADGIAADHFTAIGATVITGGGFGILEAETSVNKTIGLVWQPEFADFNASVDYFDIDVEDQIQQFGATNVVMGCYESDFFPNEPLCDLFTRRTADNGVTDVRDSFINIATQRTRGFDFAAVYGVDVFNGRLQFDAQATRQIENSSGITVATAEDISGEFGSPEWVGRLFTTYDIGAWNLNWSLRYIGAVSNTKSFGGNTATYRGETVAVVLDSSPVVYHDLSITRDFAGSGLTATLGVANFTDEEPPRVSTTGVGREVQFVGRSARYHQYDTFGRRIFLNVQWAFSE